MQGVAFVCVCMHGAVHELLWYAILPSSRACASISDCNHLTSSAGDDVRKSCVYINAQSSWLNKASDSPSV